MSSSDVSIFDPQSERPSAVAINCTVTRRREPERWKLPLTTASRRARAPPPPGPRDGPGGGGARARRDAVVNGSFQRSGSRLRVTVQLIATADGRSLWGSKIDTSLDDIFQMQDEVSRRIAQALEVELSPSDERRLAGAARPAGETYEMYLKGRFHLLRETLADARAAIECFEKAGQADPEFALAWAGLSAACVRMGFTFEPEGEWLVRAEAAYEKALAIDSRLPEGRLLKG